MRRVVSLAAMAFVLLASAAVAQGPMGGLGMGGGMGKSAGKSGGPDFWRGLDYTPVIGAWAEYQMTAGDGEPTTMKVSIVGREGESYWYESVMSNHEGERVVTKVLASGNPSDEGTLERMILKSGDDPAMEMPLQMMGMRMEGMGMGDAPEPEGEPNEMAAPSQVDMGVESVTVPAGTFTAQHWKFGDGEDAYDMWISKGVGPYGVVKGLSPETEMVLVAYGDGATSLITEEPQAFPMPGFGGMPMGE